jgi:CPA2 family monovalent cation:H+ antiporter-2
MYRMDLVRNPIMMGLILSTTSLGVVVPVLKEQGLIGGRFGQTMLLAALIADFATMLLITVEVAILSTGLTLETLLVLVLFVAFFFAYRFGVLFFNRIKAVRRVMEELSSATAQIKIRMAIVLMLLFVALSELLGAEIILGSFLAGVIISLLRTPDDDHIIGQLETIGYGFIIPIFFIKVGVDLNFSALFASSNALLVMPILLVAAFLIKILAGQVFRFSFSLKESIAGGILLSSRLSLIIAAVAIGARLGVISESVNAAVIVVAVISVTLSPLLFNRLMPRGERAARRIKLVAGASELGLQVARHLRDHDEEVIVISPDELRAKKARQQGFEVVVGRLEEQDPAIEPVLENADSLLVAYSDEQLNYEVCRTARTVYGFKNVITHVSDPQLVPRFRQLGVRTMNTVLDLASLLALLGRNPSIYDLLMSADDDKELIQIEIENELCFNRKLRDLVLPGDALVVSLRRNGDLLVPHGNTQLSRGDELTIVGSLDCIDTARQLFRGPCE